MQKLLFGYELDENNNILNNKEENIVASFSNYIDLFLNSIRRNSNFLIKFNS